MAQRKVCGIRFASYVRGIGVIAGSENRHSLFCKFFRKNSDSLQLPQHSLYAYLNLNQLNHPKVSKFRFPPGQYASYVVETLPFQSTPALPNNMHPLSSAPMLI